MPKVHFVNVSPGDCTIIEHLSGRVTMVDICDGYIDQETTKLALLVEKALKPRGDFGMRKYPTNPIAYARALGITDVHRFVLTHPDMDHMDGLDALVDQIGIANFWCTSVQREKPTFPLLCPYREEDWKRYERLRDGKEPGVTAIRNLAGRRFAFANQGEDGTSGGDGLYILAPDAELVAEASHGGDINDGSYVLLYRSPGGRVLIPGDAHDATWEYVLKHHAADVKGCAVMIAPHHGRGSSRCYDFLDHIKPKLTLFGCAPSEHLDYAAWNHRGLDFITSNQAGNVVLDIGDKQIHVYIQNESFASAKGASGTLKNGQGYTYLQTVADRNELAEAQAILRALAGLSAHP